MLTSSPCPGRARARPSLGEEGRAPAAVRGGARRRAEEVRGGVGGQRGLSRMGARRLPAARRQRGTYRTEGPPAARRGAGPGWETAARAPYLLERAGEERACYLAARRRAAACRPPADRGGEKRRAAAGRPPRPAGQAAGQAARGGAGLRPGPAGLQPGPARAGDRPECWAAGSGERVRGEGYIYLFKYIYIGLYIYLNIYIGR